MFRRQQETLIRGEQEGNILISGLFTGDFIATLPKDQKDAAFPSA